jgi:hypothetical protein
MFGSKKVQLTEDKIKLNEHKKRVFAFINELTIQLGAFDDIETPVNSAWRGLFVAAFTGAVLPIGVQINSAPVFYAGNGSLDIALEAVSVTEDEVEGPPSFFCYSDMNAYEVSQYKNWLNQQVTMKNGDIASTIQDVVTYIMVVSIMGVVEVAVDEIVLKMQEETLAGKCTIEQMGGTPYPVPNFPNATADDIDFEYYTRFKDSNPDHVAYAEDLKSAFPRFVEGHPALTQVRNGILEWVKVNLGEGYHQVVNQKFNSL